MMLAHRYSDADTSVPIIITVIIEAYAYNPLASMVIVKESTKSNRRKYELVVILFHWTLEVHIQKCCRNRHCRNKQVNVRSIGTGVYFLMFFNIEH